jgi:hypothetical protein
MSPDEAIEAAAAAEAETRYRNQLAREAYEAGRQAGYRQAAADEEARWRQTPPVLVPHSPSHAELEERRWGPGGREHFADPRPSDFPGREISRPHARPEPEREMEASA